MSWVNRQVKFLPSLLIKYHPHNVVQIIIMHRELKDRVWLGIGYRNRNMRLDALSDKLSLRMAYSYDLSLAILENYTNGSHEIFFKLCLRYAERL